MHSLLVETSSFDQIIDRTGDDVIRGWEEQLGEAGSAAHEIRLLLGGNPMISDRGRGVYRVIVQGLTEIDDREIRKAIKRHIARLHAFLVKRIRKARMSGQLIAKADPELIAWLLMHLALGYGMIAPLSVPGHSRDASGDHILRLLSRLLTG